MKRRKILIFAHVPPPHHGQSVMVQILLEGLSADPRFEVHHVDARVSDDLEDVGSFRLQKFIRLFKCIFQAWWLRLRHGRMAFYYVPAPAKRSAIMRDWMVMALCRPLFSKLVLHWHAYGLGEWVAAGNDWQRKLTRWALGNAELAIVLNNYNKRDAAVFEPKRIEVVPNGIADQFPDYETVLAPRREKRAAQLRKLVGYATAVGAKHSNILKNVGMSSEGSREGLSGSHGGAEGAEEEMRHGKKLERVRFLFLGHLIESKGVFVAIEATSLANEELRKSNAPWRAHLTLAGSFASEEEKERVMAAMEKVNSDGKKWEGGKVGRWEGTKAADNEGVYVELAGFLGAGQKKAALEGADCLVFPTFYENEAQPLVLLEAMSAGLTVITTSWRGIAEPFPQGYPLMLKPRAVGPLAAVLSDLCTLISAPHLRTKYECEYKVDFFSPRIANSIISMIS